MTGPANVRPVRWATDEEFRAVIAATPRQGDRHILLALRLHDLNPENHRGATPGYKRLAALTGLDAGYVRNRLSALARGGPIHRVSDSGLLTAYFILAPKPVTSGDDMAAQPVIPESDIERSATISPPVTPGSDKRGASIPPPVTDLSPPEVHSNRKNYKGDSPKTTEKPGRESWLSPFIGAWQVQYGGDPNSGRLARTLSPLRDKYGADAALLAWRCYLENTPARFNPSPEKFAETFGTWSLQAGRATRVRELEVLEA